MSRTERIQQKVSQELQPALLLEVENESSGHNVPSGSESHFKVIAVSKRFEGLSRVDRHRLIKNLLAEEFQSGLHALSLHLYTESEWEQKKLVPSSPLCQHKKNK